MQTQSQCNNSDFYLKVNELSNQACDNIDELLTQLGLRYKRCGKIITAKCGVHGGDNPQALNIYPDGHSIRGYWICRSRHCESKYKKTLVGLVRGILSHQSGREVTFMESINYLCQFLGYKSLHDIKPPESYIVERRRYTNTFANELFPQNKPNGWTREKVRGKLEIPSSYYIARNYTQSVLDKYDIGLDSKIGRIVVPVYDNDYRYAIGFLGRSIHTKCLKCGYYHDSRSKCPVTPEECLKASKWINSKGFNSGESLYNYWFAKDHVQNTGKAILVESAGNVWRCVQNGVHNVVGTYGAQLTPKQELLLAMLGTMYVVLLYDNDEAGKEATEQIRSRIQRRFHVNVVSFSDYNDIGEMTDEYFNSVIKNHL